MSAESCHILQYGHWKSLERIIQTFAFGFPRMRALSARATNGSTDEPVVDGVEADDASLAGACALGDAAAAGVALSTVAGADFAVASPAPLQAERRAIAMMRREIVIDECRNESARLGRPRTADRRGDCRGAVKISPVGPKSLRVRFITDLYRAYLLHPGSLELANAMPAIRGGKRRSTR